MDKLQNGEYLAPQVEVIELIGQSIICESDMTIDTFEDGGTF